MRRLARSAAALAAASIATFAAGPLSSPPAFAAPKSIVLPQQAEPLVPSSLPGYAKAQANCVACHSTEYFRYQPPSAPRPYWDAMVKRMKLVFNAPVADDDMPDIVDYLVKTYGAEQPK